MSDQQLSELYSDFALAEFYDANQSKRQDFEYCAGLAQTAGSVLDLGCGTGALAISLSGGRRVVGVDPAGAMLELARSKEGSEDIRWIEGDARSVRLGETFDLIVLTGHAFQVFLEAKHQIECLCTVASHLAPGGVFVFDSRNPDFPGSKERTKAQTLHTFHHPDYGIVEKWNISRYDPATRILTYGNHYRTGESDRVRSAEDKIMYSSIPDLADCIDKAGLTVERWLGDWNGEPFMPDSREIIPVGRLK